MKRTLIVDFDCPYKNNHFNLLLCEDCLTQRKFAESIQEGIITPTPFAPTDYKFPWTQDSSSTNGVYDNTTWTSPGSTSIDNTTITIA